MILSLAACNKSVQSKDAVRQAVVDYLAAKSFPVKPSPDGKQPATMTVDVTSVTFDGAKAVAAVAIGAKGAPSGMTMSYKLEQQGGKWVVTGPSASHPGATMPADGGGASPHGGGATPDNPHGGMAPGGGSAMPTPDELPPVKKK